MTEAIIFYRHARPRGVTGARGSSSREGYSETPTHCTRGTGQIVETKRRFKGETVFKGPSGDVGKKWDSVCFFVGYCFELKVVKISLQIL